MQYYEKEFFMCLKKDRVIFLGGALVFHTFSHILLLFLVFFVYTAFINFLTLKVRIR